MKRVQLLLLPLLLTGISFYLSCEKESQIAKMSQANGASLSVRGLKDTIGFAFTAEQIELVASQSEKLEKDGLETNDRKFGLSDDTRWIAAICPHDDHLLAGRVYVHVFRHLTAKRIIIFGVAHKASNWKVEDKLIFDSFRMWQGPYGPVKVSAIRDEILKTLPKNDYLVSNEFQAEEHSVEGIVPFIQYYLPEAEIVSILVPYMDWPRIEALSQHLASALARIIRRNNWRLGEDIAFICSNDGDHYGDQDWGGKDYAPFGADECGHRIAAVQDSLLAETTLAGRLAADKLKSFCRQVWGEDDLTSYKIRWCGRFTIPFGLNCVRQIAERRDHPELVGCLLRYDTSYRSGKLPLPDIGIGTTAPNNIHHWVGYSAIGYK